MAYFTVMTPAQDSPPPHEILRKLAARSRRSDAVADQHRAERNAAIYDVLRVQRSMTQADVCRATDLTREHISRILAKVEADRAHGSA